MTWPRGLVACLAVSTGHALQLHEVQHRDALAQKGKFKRSSTLQRVWLDEKEVENRGSHCLDGSVPAYHFAEGSEEGKFLFWFKGGGYCTSESDCASYLPIPEFAESIDRMPIHNHDAFANYNHVYVSNCDLGIYMGDRSEPVEYNGNKLYFQGARILNHIVDSLSSNYTLTEVLMAGGSGGGHSLFAVADYVKGFLPSSVSKFGVAPINGWYISDDTELASMFKLQNMQSTISESCNQAFSSTERYKCVDPTVAYRYTRANMFMTQIFDYTFEWNATDEVITAYNNCLSAETGATQACDDSSVELLQNYLNNFTQQLKTYPSFYENGEGGYLSTCTTHTFYNEEDLFNSYANNGVTVGDAISKWWSSLGTNPAAVWYLPCTLGNAQHAQCESSCATHR